MVSFWIGLLLAQALCVLCNFLAGLLPSSLLLYHETGWYVRTEESGLGARPFFSGFPIPSVPPLLVLHDGTGMQVGPSGSPRPESARHRRFHACSSTPSSQNIVAAGAAAAAAASGVWAALLSVGSVTSLLLTPHSEQSSKTRKSNGGRVILAIFGAPPE